MTAFTKVHQKRLLNVVRALKESPNPKAFDMRQFGYGKDDINEDGMAWVSGEYVPNKCGTPACALGHYAARPDLQRKFKLKDSGRVYTTSGRLISIGGIMTKTNPVLVHFGISPEESFELFSSMGCNDAQTPQEAMSYIKKFVANKIKKAKKGKKRA